MRRRKKQQPASPRPRPELTEAERIYIEHGLAAVEAAYIGELADSHDLRVREWAERMFMELKAFREDWRHIRGRCRYCGQVEKGHYCTVPTALSLTEAAEKVLADGEA